MKKKRLIPITFICFFICIMIVLAAYIVAVRTINKKNRIVEDVDYGSKRLDGYSEEIKSKNIVSFEYINSDYSLSCELINDELRVTIKAKSFDIKYVSRDKNLLTELQKVIEKYELYKNNGYEQKLSRLPSGYGDFLSIKYDSDEKIYKYSNQIRLLSSDSYNEIYELFSKNATENDYVLKKTDDDVVIESDFNEEFLQGTWEGTCADKYYKVVFKNQVVSIYINNLISDIKVYRIVDGVVVNNNLLTGKTDRKDYRSFSNFKTVSNFRKKSDSMLETHLLDDDYTTCELKR